MDVRRGAVAFDAFRLGVALVSAVVILAAAQEAATTAAGEVVIAWHVTIARELVRPLDGAAQSRRVGCSTRSTMPSFARCRARRWARASPSRGRTA